MFARIVAACALGMASYSAVAFASLADYEMHLNRTLAGEGSTAVDCQRAIAGFLSKSATIPSGGFVSGGEAHIEKSTFQIRPEELNHNVISAENLTISATGPEPVVLLLPETALREKTSVYRRVDADLYVRIPAASFASAGYLAYDVQYPGEYVIAEEDTASPSPAAGLGNDFFDFSPVSPAPEAKSAWRLYPVAPETISGPVPLVLIHGLGGDHWDDFAHWAEHSEEAANLRTHFQVWNFTHPVSGVTAPIGFSSAYPAFSESIVAYLARFIQDAETSGVEVDGKRHFFPQGQYAMLTHSQGGIKARAFLLNYPQHADRVVAVVSLACPHMGSPWATPEWVRHTLSSIGLNTESLGEKILEGAFAELLLNGYFNIKRQSDLDTGWGNFDMQGGFGIPTRDFSTWYWPWGIRQATISPRDANLTYARDFPDISDETFEPPQLYETYCGGLDLITPSERGQMHLDKFFIYAGYIDVIDDFTRALAGMGWDNRDDRLQMNSGLRLVQLLMGIVESEGSAYPLGTYNVGDGFVPIQSQLLMDGTEMTLLYNTKTVRGWEVPVQPIELKQDVIDAHTLALPERLRILKGWSHLDTVTGRYDPENGHSELFQRVLDDLLSVLPEDGR